MKANQIVGKTIGHVVQVRFESTTGKSEWVLDAIVFTDGSVLRFHTVEGEGDYGVAGVYPARAI